LPKFFISLDEVDQLGVYVAAMAILAHGNLCGKNTKIQHMFGYFGRSGK
jgi:hypothetical protein